MLLLYNITLSIFSTLPHDQTNCKSILFPNIARPGHSIWDAASRKTFEIHIDALSHAILVPETSALFEKDWLEQCSSGVHVVLSKQTSKFASLVYQYPRYYLK